MFSYATHQRNFIREQKPCAFQGNPITNIKITSNRTTEIKKL